MHARVLTLGRRLLDVLVPGSCAACAEPLGSFGLFCPRCAREAQLKLHQGSLDGVPTVSLGPYAGPLKDAIRRFKYDKRAELAEPLARALLAHTQAEVAFGGRDLVPVPLHPMRLAERGFNQSALLAKGLARPASAVYCPRALLRRSNTARQARLERSAREENLREQIQARHPPSGRPVVLVDDVLTTGSTARACLSALRSVNARVELIVVLARAGV